MNQLLELSLTGYGYLLAVKETPQGTLVTIRVLTSSLDDVELHCIAENCGVSAELYRVKGKCRVGECVLLQFKVDYLRFGYNYPGLTKEDPQHMVQLQGKLITVYGWIQDGEKPQVTSLKDVLEVINIHRHLPG